MGGDASDPFLPASKASKCRRKQNAKCKWLAPGRRKECPKIHLTQSEIVVY